MTVSLLIETSESRYEVFFDVADAETASDKLAAILTDVEKRYVRKRSRDAAPARPKPPSVAGASVQAGAK